jgi:hypothetical protein
MSKPSSSRLTRSRKKRRPARGLPVELCDLLNDRLRRIEMLAALMSASRHDLLVPGVVEDAGFWIGTEVRAIKGLLDATEKASQP